ncbi:MAG TPA: efflux RND transporter permease subunit, partial [Isosphaeraceae bacterium]|nr:efflux RND transporter permease subunit [Isosphaeraceae bacterium]
ISYPGASAVVVTDTVAAPIEQQVNGVEGMLYMSSQMGNDGSYSLTVTFDVGTDLNQDLVMVQNRVTLAMPQLPTAVQNQGITIRKKTPDILMIVNFFSPDGRYDDIYLSNFATIYVRDELLRVYGVSDINYLGQRDYSIRAWLDPQKLAAHNMTAIDVAQAIRNQNLDAPAGRVGQPPAPAGQSAQLPLDTLGRLTEPDQFGDIIVKVNPATAAAGAELTADSIGGSSTGSSPSVSSSSSSSGGGAPSPSGGGQMQIDTTLVDAIGGMSTVNDTAGTISPPTIGPTIRLGYSGGAGTTGTASSTASLLITGPTSAFPTAAFPGGVTTGGGATSGGGGTTGGGATTAGGTSSGSAAGGTGGSGSGGAGALNNSQRIGSALSATSGAASTSMSLPNPADAVVRLRDVARVELGAQNYNQACIFDGHPSVGLSIYQLPGTNALDVAQRVEARMKELRSRFPDGVEYSTAYDTTPFIRESVADVFQTLLEAVVLVGIVVLLFLQDWKAMILPMIDVPVSLIGTLAVMAALGFSLNNISLFGLVLAIGIVVDDAIVVLENIERLMATGLDVRTATIKAMEEVTGPIVAVALVLSAVFVPCAFIGGITGQFFRQFAVTIAVSTIISAINAVTMTPSRAVLIFKTEEGQGHALHREALPWWTFAVLGGLLTIGLGSRFLEISGLALQAKEILPENQYLRWAVWSVPGALVGGVIGRLLIGPVNSLLGWFFRGFNRVFDEITHVYGWFVGKLLHM